MSSSTDAGAAVFPGSPPDDGILFCFRRAVARDLRSPLSEHRGSQDVEQCFRTILPLARRAQITRLADLTGLDRLGFPVAQAVRPAALSEVTSLGRGLSLMEAAVGATMESLERFYAEAIPQERVFLATANELRVTEGLFENLLVAKRAGDWRRAEIPWTMGIDAATGAQQPVPLELVHTRYTDPAPIGDGLFLRTTTGLACSMTVTGAFIHGLFECIERDAIARAFATHGFFDRRRMATSGLGDRVDRILARAAKHGVSFGLWHAPSPADIPVVWCQAIEAGPREPILSLPTEGYAAGASLEAAATGAMLEALSARPGAISGARDDQTREHYRRSTDELVKSARRLILELPSEPQQIDFELATPLFLGTFIERIVVAGLGPVVAVPVGSDAETGVQCVRTILSGALPFTVLR